MLLYMAAAATTMTNTTIFIPHRFLHIAVAQGRRAVSYVLARKMAALHVLDIKEHNGQVMLPLCTVWIFRTCAKHPGMPVNINHKG